MARTLLAGARTRRRMRVAVAVRAVALLALLEGVAAVAPAAAQYLDERNGGLSQTMRSAIRFYDQGQDSEAMDGFMDVLSAGDPAERNMANEYINLITQRMFMGSTIDVKPDHPRPVPATVAESAPGPDGTPGRVRPPLEVDTREFQEHLPGRTDAEPAAATKAVMKREIDAKLRALGRGFLAELEGYSDVRILMADRQHPRAIGIPSDEIFERGIVFKRSAAKLLSSLSGLVYCLGATQVVLLPEGAVVGDAKILDMRRTMGLSAHLYAAGVAPPRVRVNLLNSQIDIPKNMLDFRGIIIVFVYNQPLPLLADSALPDDGGPPVSLGVWPDKFRSDRGEGAVIEFSVAEPVAGLIGWKFQLRPAAMGPGADLTPLQEVIGASPVFHQVYWNGRRNYFGSELSSGRYEIVLSATDGKNRSRTLHRWITLESSVPAPAGPAEKPAVKPAVEATVAAAPAAAPPPAELKPEPKAPVKYVEIKKVRHLTNPRKAKAKRAAAKKKAAKAAEKSDEPAGEPGADGSPPPAQPEASKGSAPPAAPAKTPAAGPGAPGGEKAPAENKPASGTVNYTITFAKGTQQMSADADRTIGRVVESLQAYPRENLNIVGYASQAEPDAQKLASDRANVVSGLLVNRYSVDPARIRSESKVVSEERYEVDIFSVAARE